MFAVIKSGGKQYRVSEGEILDVEKLAGNRGDQVSFEEVLLVSRENDLQIGRPFVGGARVMGEILDQVKGPKLIIYKRKRRKGYRLKKGHRQPLTRLRVKEITV